MKYSPYAIRASKYLALLFFTILAGVFSSSADAKVSFVYRFDFRPPSEIFADGFYAWGHNLDLTNHVLTWNQESGFVATTSSYQSALQFAESGFQGRASGVAGYIYRVEADDSFYDVNFSLQHFLLQERLAGIEDRHRTAERDIEAALDAFLGEQEFVATQGIPHERISWAVEVRGVRQPDGHVQVEEGAFQSNPSWTGARNTFANENPYAMTWPSDAPPSSCSDSASGSGSDSEGPAAANCTGDLYAIAGPSGYIHHPSQFSGCESPKRKKRSGGENVCPAKLPLVNLSRLMRLYILTLSSEN